MFQNFRTVEVNYDTDDSGIYRAKLGDEARDAKIILDTSKTKIDLPLDYEEAEEVQEEDVERRRGRKNLR